MTPNKIFLLEDIYKSFEVGNQQVEVLKGVSCDLDKAEFLILFGPSGCGKSTLLHTMLGLEPPTKGQVMFLGEDFYKYDQDGRAEIRKKKVGMVYQQPYWIKALSVIENVAFPLTILGYNHSDSVKAAEEKLELVGMQDWRDYYPTELSSGQQQKVSLARALVNNPEVIVTDEPTGNLDTKSGEELMKLIKDLNDETKTIVMVTHDLEYLSFASRILHMVDGVIDKEYKGGIDKDEITKLTFEGKKGNNHNNHNGA